MDEMKVKKEHIWNVRTSDNSNVLWVKRLWGRWSRRCVVVLVLPVKTRGVCVGGKQTFLTLSKERKQDTNNEEEIKLWCTEQHTHTHIQWKQQELWESVTSATTCTQQASQSRLILRPDHRIQTHHQQKDDDKQKIQFRTFMFKNQTSTLLFQGTVQHTQTHTHTQTKSTWEQDLMTCFC